MHLSFPASYFGLFPSDTTARLISFRFFGGWVLLSATYLFSWRSPDSSASALCHLLMNHSAPPSIKVHHPSMSSALVFHFPPSFSSPILNDSGFSPSRRIQSCCPPDAPLAAHRLSQQDNFQQPFAPHAHDAAREQQSPFAHRTSMVSTQPAQVKASAYGSGWSVRFPLRRPMTRVTNLRCVPFSAL